MPVIEEVNGSQSDENENPAQSLEEFLKQRSSPEQLAIGGVLGGISGLISMKIGKSVATIVGVSIILAQVGSHQGYVNINWTKLKKDIVEAADKSDASKKLSLYSRTLNKIQSALSIHPYFCSGFLGGFLIGLAF